MYPRNATVREPIAIGAVIQISDGVVQTSGVTVRIIPIGVAESDGAGTTAYSTNGIVYYTPTQAETNYTSFILIASKSGCVPVSVTVVTTDAATPGRVRLDAVTHTSAVIPTVTAVTNAVTLPASASINITGNITGNLSGSVGSVTGAVGSVTGNVGGNVVGSVGSVTGAVGSVTGNVVGSVGSVTARVTANTDQWNGVAVTGMPMPTYTQPTGFLSANFGNLDAAITSRMATYTQPTGFLAADFTRLDAAVSSRMATYTQPTGFLAATFPTTVASPTNITGGTITTVSGNVNGSVGSVTNRVTANVDQWSGQAVALDTDNYPVVSVWNFRDTSLSSWLPLHGRLATIITTLNTIDDFIDTEVAAIKTVTDKMDTMLVLDGSVWQFTVNALENAPAGGGGSGDASQATLLLVKAKTDLIVAGEVQFTAMVGSAGRISQPIMIGDDYLAANGRAFQWTIPARAGYVVGTSTCRFGGSNAELGTSWNVTGTVSDLGGGEWRLSFDLSKSVTGALLEGYYRWSVELVSAGGTEVTEVYSGRNVEVRAKQT